MALRTGDIDIEMTDENGVKGKTPKESVTPLKSKRKEQESVSGIQPSLKSHQKQL